jgi:hypothetical protein
LSGHAARAGHASHAACVCMRAVPIPRADPQGSSHCCSLLSQLTRNAVGWPVQGRLLRAAHRGSCLHPRSWPECGGNGKPVSPHEPREHQPRDPWSFGGSWGGSWAACVLLETQGGCGGKAEKLLSQLAMLAATERAREGGESGAMSAIRRCHPNHAPSLGCVARTV